jgi:hypothetical protein
MAVSYVLWSWRTFFGLPMRSPPVYGFPRAGSIGPLARARCRPFNAVDTGASMIATWIAGLTTCGSRRGLRAEGG